MHFIGSHLRDLQHRLYARDETINGRGVREGGWRRTVLAVVLPTLALFCSLQPRAKWAVVQHCRPASACRSLLSPRRSDSSAYTAAAAVLSPTPHSFAARVYRLVRPHSFTHKTIRARRRPTIPPVATLSRANSRSATITTAAFVCPLSAAYSWARFATVICPL